MQIPDKMMKQIVLSVMAGTVPDDYDLTPQPVSMTFIYGVGAGGLTPFEIFLRDMVPGETRELQLSNTDLEPFLGCHYALLIQRMGCHPRPEECYLRFTFEEVNEAENRDIVKAISHSLAKGGCGGGCGCGCS